MKKPVFIFVLMTIALHVKAQNCDSLTIKMTDKFTGEVTISNRVPIIIYSDDKVKCNILLTKDKHHSSLTFYISPKKFGCTDETSHIYFLTEDGTKLDTKNSLNLNCQGFTIINFGSWVDAKRVTNFLHDYYIKSIRVESRTTHFDFDLDPKIADEIKQVVLCFDSLKL